MESSGALLFVAVLIAAILLDVWILVLWRRRRRNSGHLDAGTGSATQSLGEPSPVLAFIKNFRLQAIHPRTLFALPAVRPALLLRRWDASAARTGAKPAAITWASALEVSAICLWAAWVGKKLLIFSPLILPGGNEFANLTQSHYAWTFLSRCGTCMLWNGTVNGGAPAFAELSGAILHPLVFLPVLAWGVVDGAKVTIIAALALAGVAQWLLSGRLGLGRFARLWSAFVIVTGGHLVGKMDNGNIALVLGLACANLVLAFGVDLLYNRNRKALVWLAVATTLLILSGEGYIQVGSVLSLYPLLAVLILLGPGEKKQAGRDLAVSIGLAVLLSGVFLVPLLHFMPQVTKDGDPLLRNFPPLETIPLSLVIRDVSYYRIPVLGKNPYLYTHMNTIGWIPVLLALAAPLLAQPRLRRLVWAFAGGVGLVFLVTSADLPMLLVDTFSFISHLRHLTVASGLAVPLVVTLAAISLDRLLQGSALRLILQQSSGATQDSDPPAGPRMVFSASLGPVIMIPLSLLALVPLYDLSQEVLTMRDITSAGAEVQNLVTPTTQWVNPPYGAYDWTSHALAQGMKIAQTWRPWNWKYHNSPHAYYRAFAKSPSEEMDSPVKETETFLFFRNPLAEYASVRNMEESKDTACPANSRAGNIDVTCNVEEAGTLTVTENAWSGWTAWVDGKRARLLPSQWLTVKALPGEHTYQFRYRPLDVPLGLLVTLAGIVLAVRTRKYAGD